MLAFIFQNLSAQTKRALIIGVGKQKDINWGKINGDQDIPYVKEMLISAGYYKKNVISLVNEQATKSRIMDAFSLLIKSCRLNDIVYIHFSGHGQRVTDVDGDEKDCWDESWIPYDAYRYYGDKDKGEKHLIDDEIYNLLTRIKGKIGDKGKILVVVDACHSEGTTFGSRVYAYRYIKPITATTRGVSDCFIMPHRTKSRVLKKPEQWLTLSACKNFQVNQELINPKVGILSYALYTISKKGCVEMWKIEEFIKQHKGPYPQTPILTGETDKYNLSDVLK